MTYVLLMSTDADIVATPLGPGWPAVAGRFTWAQVSPGGLNLPAGSQLVVIAHGNGDEIGNAQPGTIDIDASTFLAIVYSNMANGTAPGSIYISICGPGIAEFAANVRFAAQQNRIWANTRILGHSDPVVGPVPGPNTTAWFEIYN